MSLRKLVEDLIEEIQNEELEIEESTTTGDIAGYNTPNAFKDTDGTDEDDEPEDKVVDRINKSTGYERVSENRWLELKKLTNHSIWMNSYLLLYLIIV